MRRGRAFALLIALLGVGLWAATTGSGADDSRPGGEVAQIHQDSEGSTEMRQVRGHDGEPIICPDGTPLRVDPDAEVARPSLAAFREVGRRLPADKSVGFNEYTGEFEILDSVRVKSGGIATAGEPMVYECGPGNEPTLAPLSEVDPQAGEQARRQAKESLEEIASGKDGGITGLGLEDGGEGAPERETCAAMSARTKDGEIVALLPCGAKVVDESYVKRNGRICLEVTSVDRSSATKTPARDVFCAE